MKKEPIKILLVEDNEDDYILTRNMLSDAFGLRCETEWASSYHAAVNAMRGKFYDACLIDYGLGEYNGMDVLREAATYAGRTPVILMTREDEGNSDMEAIKAGASDYLIKGRIDAPLLEKSIRYAIERKRAEEQMIRLAHYDSLTNLPNRLLFNDRLKQAIACSERNKKQCALLFLDLDNFKQINDTLGHFAGDMLLKDVADILSHCVRKVDSITRHTGGGAAENTVSRFGGDEFIILLSEISDPQNAANVAQRIIEFVSEPFFLQDHEVFVTASIGIAVYPVDGDKTDALLKNADTAMYHAKNQGRNNFQFYRESMNATALQRFALEHNMRRALERREFALHYQPLLDLRTGAMIGSEALLRWQSHENGMISPAEFIPIAEENGLIIPIGKWALRAACAQNRAWQNLGHGALRVAVNLSARQLKQRDFIETVVAAMNESDLNPGCLELELTESILMRSSEELLAVFNELKGIGVMFSLDDFGTGYSSLKYLRHFPIDKLKIDRSFVADCTRNNDDETIVKAIIALAHSLNLRVIAEGVETAEQMEFLRDEGCDEMQGYYFSRPLSVDDMTAFIKNRG